MRDPDQGLDLYKNEDSSERDSNPQSCSQKKDSLSNNVIAPPGIARESSVSGLTKTLLAQHDAYQAIDTDDREAQASFHRLQERTYWCSWSYNLRSIFCHREQTQELLFKILFVKEG